MIIKPPIAEEEHIPTGADMFFFATMAIVLVSIMTIIVVYVAAYLAPDNNIKNQLEIAWLKKKTNMEDNIHIYIVTNSKVAIKPRIGYGIECETKNDKCLLLTNRGYIAGAIKIEEYNSTDGYIWSIKNRLEN